MCVFAAVRAWGCGPLMVDRSNIDDEGEGDEGQDVPLIALGQYFAETWEEIWWILRGEILMPLIECSQGLWRELLKQLVSLPNR